jgi:hypothetical protein
MTVVKVGRKWASLALKGTTQVSDVVSVTDVWVDGGETGISPGRIFPSKEDADAHLELQKGLDLQKGWNDARKAVSNLQGNPSNLTKENLEALRKALTDLGITA